MGKKYNIESISFSKGFLCIKIDSAEYRFKLSIISKSLAAASEDELNNFIISPSGYGIHWPKLDEDISVAGLLKLAKG
jgi:hypothetical protein